MQILDALSYTVPKVGITSNDHHDEEEISDLDNENDNNTDGPPTEFRKPDASFGWRQLNREQHFYLVFMQIAS